MLATQNQRLKNFAQLLGFGGLLPLGLKKKALHSRVEFQWLILDAGNNHISAIIAPATVAGSGFSALLSGNRGKP
jgi:hypothetical protein